MNNIMYGKYSSTTRYVPKLIQHRHIMSHTHTHTHTHTHAHTHTHTHYTDEKVIWQVTLYSIPADWILTIYVQARLLQTINLNNLRQTN